ncbi:MAG: GntR family transcriptional regulator [Phycisphaerales bacterium]|nr:GntR family transcriptional regulator [Phycisphaerales bacterium]
MILRLDHHSGEAIYRQIVEAVKYKVAAGELEEGQQLPSIRGLAEELAINPRTVVKAYEELEHAGVVVMRHGQGMFVSGRGDATSARVRREAIRDLARRLLAEATRLGASPKEVLEIVRTESQRLTPRAKEVA